MNITNIAKAVEIKNQNITDLWQEKTLRYGFLATPNTLILYRARLKITGNEFTLIITVFALHSLGKQAIKDREIAFNSGMDVNSKRYFRERRSLETKGYLKTKVKKVCEAGQYKTKGVIYDFTGLIEKICELVDEDERLKKEKQENKNNEPSKKEESKSATTPPDSKEKKNSEQSKKETTKNNTSKSEVENKADTTTDNLLLNNFLVAYRQMHNELSVEKLNQARYSKQKKYLVEIFDKIENKKIQYNDVLDKAKELFSKLSEDKKTSLAFQDTVARAVSIVGNSKTASAESKKYKANNFDDVMNKNKRNLLYIL